MIAYLMIFPPRLWTPETNNLVSLLTIHKVFIHFLFKFNGFNDWLIDLTIQ